MKRIVFALLFPCLVYAGEVISVQGDVKVFVKNAWQGVKTKDQIASGTKIMTGVKSTLEIKTPSGVMLVKPMTLMTYTEKVSASESSTDVDLKNGTIQVKYSKPPQGKAEFRVQTPKGTASVRGTEEVVSYDAVSGMNVSVLIGQVEVVGRQLYEGNSLAVNPSGDVWDDVASLREAVGVLDEVKDDAFEQDLRKLLDQLHEKSLSLEDLAKILGDPQKL